MTQTERQRIKELQREYDNMPTHVQEEEDNYLDEITIPFAVKVLFAMLVIAALSFVGALISVYLINRFGS